MTLAATLCNQRVATGICEGEAGVFMHGPTFMGNPLACAAANASLELLQAASWPRLVHGIEQQFRRELAAVRDLPAVADVRVLGAIGVVELHKPVEMKKVVPKLVDLGVWLRPFGRLLYSMPPYIVSEAQLSSITRAMRVICEDLSA